MTESLFEVWMDEVSWCVCATWYTLNNSEASYSGWLHATETSHNLESFMSLVVAVNVAVTGHSKLWLDSCSNAHE